MIRKKYIFGAGTRPHTGKDVVNVDRLPLPAIEVIHDLDVYPYPFPDSSGLHINAAHVIEHLSDVPRFMDECHRILCPGGTLYLETPHAENIALSFSDPTHKQHLTEHSFINYFTLEGIENFGYSKFAWSILHIKTVDGVIFVHLMPIPDYMYQDEILRRLNNVHDENYLDALIKKTTPQWEGVDADEFMDMVRGREPEQRITPAKITSLEPNQIFVFGSNLAAKHGKGAANDAVKFGASFGVAEGISGQTFAIPTRDERIQTLGLIEIESSAKHFIAYAEQHERLNFLVTPIGCGLAGYKPEQIAPFFAQCLEMKNVWLPQSFLDVLKK